MSELGPELRAQLGIPATGGRTRPKLSTAGSGGWTLLCAACGFLPTSAKTAAEHSDQTGHCSWRLPLDQVVS